jgi:hypothetical protein
MSQPASGRATVVALRVFCICAFSPLRIVVSTMKTLTAAETGSVVYRWRPIALDRMETAAQFPSQPTSDVPQIPMASGKCFRFDGRQFCE